VNRPHVSLESVKPRSRTVSTSIQAIPPQARTKDPQFLALLAGASRSEGAAVIVIEVRIEQHACVQVGVASAGSRLGSDFLAR